MRNKGGKREREKGKENESRLEEQKGGQDVVCVRACGERERKRTQTDERTNHLAEKKEFQNCSLSRFSLSFFLDPLGTLKPGLSSFCAPLSFSSLRAWVRAGENERGQQHGIILL